MFQSYKIIQIDLLRSLWKNSHSKQIYLIETVPNLGKILVEPKKMLKEAMMSRLLHSLLQCHMKVSFLKGYELY